jgi:hypothetical protein
LSRPSRYQSLDDDAAADIWRHHDLRRELIELLGLRSSEISYLHRTLDIGQPVPLEVRASYSREEALAGFGATRVHKRMELQIGVYFHEPSQGDLFLVTLQEAESEYSPTTHYLDYLW